MLKRYVFYLICLLLLGLATFAVRNCKVVNSLREEVETYQRNERGFIDAIEHYKNCNDLSCAKVDELTLSLDDAYKVIGEDKKTIESLNVKLKNMEQLTKVATKTEIKVVERLKDTTIVKERETIFRDTIHDVRYVDVVKPYYEVHATIVHDTIDMDITTHDSLLIVESVEYKRFLGFLWKTKRIKRRTFDVIAKNPNTVIDDFKVVTIKK